MASVTITKGDVTEVKRLMNPPQGVKDIVAATVYLMGESGGKDLWADAVKMLRDVKVFMQKLEQFDAKTCDPKSVDKAKGLMENYTEDGLKKQSMAAASFYRWNKEVLSTCDKSG